MNRVKVEVRVRRSKAECEAERRRKTKEAIDQILANQITRYVGMDEVIEEVKREMNLELPDDDRDGILIPGGNLRELRQG